MYYVNDLPHIGHAYTTLSCDISARFKRLDDFDVFFLTGTDEHGQKVETAANNKNVKPHDFVDEVSQNFNNLLNCAYFHINPFLPQAPTPPIGPLCHTTGRCTYRPSATC